MAVDGARELDEVRLAQQLSVYTSGEKQPLPMSFGAAQGKRVLRVGQMVTGVDEEQLFGTRYPRIEGRARLKCCT